MRLAASRSGRIQTWLLFAVFVAIGFGWFGGGSHLVKANRLRASGAHVPGSITSVSAGDSAKGATAYYEFTLDGQKRYGYSKVSGQMAGTLNPGKPVTVTYLPDDPGTTCLDPEAVAEQGRTGVFLTLIVEAILAAIFLPLVVNAERDRAKGESIAAAVVIGVMAVGGLAGLVFGVLPGFSKAKSLIAHGQAIPAQITGVYDDDHGRYADYTYSVAGAFYHGKARYQGGYGDRGPIQVYYLPEQPSFSARDPQQNLRDVQFGAVFLTVWLTIVFVMGLGIYRWTRMRRNL